MASTHSEFASRLSFDEESITEVTVDSTTQASLFTGSGKPEIFVISNPSGNKFLWLKPNDNTTNKRGIIVPPLGQRVYPGSVDHQCFGIMDSGGTVTINIVRFF